MTTRRLYALTDGQVAVIGSAVYHLTYGAQQLDEHEASRIGHALTPLDTDAAVERMARAIADLEPGEPWPTNAELGGGPTGTRDDEYRHECMDRARAALDAALGTGEES